MPQAVPTQNGLSHHAAHPLRVSPIRGGLHQQRGRVSCFQTAMTEEARVTRTHTASDGAALV